MTYDQGLKQITLLTRPRLRRPPPGMCRPPGTRHPHAPGRRSAPLRGQRRRRGRRSRRAAGVPRRHDPVRKCQRPPRQLVTTKQLTTDKANSMLATCRRIGSVAAGRQVCIVCFSTHCVALATAMQQGSHLDAQRLHGRDEVLARLTRVLRIRLGRWLAGEPLHLRYTTGKSRSCGSVWSAHYTVNLADTLLASCCIS